MFDAAQTDLQRTRGTARVSFTAGGGLGDLYQQGSAKVMLPRCYGPAPEAVFLNTAGGLTGGDRLSYRVDLAPGTRLVATTQTAERAYASTGGAAEVTVTLNVADGAHLDWLPQETIVFDSAALHRTTRITLGAGATCLFAEMVTLGRGAMGETLRTLDLLDRRIVTRGDDPLFTDPLRLTGLDLARRGPAGLADAAALATIVLVSPDAEDRLAALRRILPDLAAASAWDGRLVIRAMSPDPYRLRRALAAILIHLRGGDLPRVWQY